MNYEHFRGKNVTATVWIQWVHISVSLMDTDEQLLLTFIIKFLRETCTQYQTAIGKRNDGSECKPQWYNTRKATIRMKSGNKRGEQRGSD